MGKRNEWEFKFVASVLQTACEERILYHNTRAEALTWELSETNEKRMRLMSSTTAELPVYNPNVTQTWQAPGLPAEVQQLTNDMAKLRQRVDDHQQRVRDYRDWSYLFALDLGASFSLTYEDVAYFFDHIGNQQGGQKPEDKKSYGVEAEKKAS